MTTLPLRGRRNPAGSRSGFTLVEILIVVVILGILAAIAVPKLSNASQVAREGSLKEDLRLLRTQVGVYRANHGDISPGYPAGNTSATPTQQTFIDQLTLYTDLVGNASATADSTYKWGPYVNAVPANPINTFSTLKILGPTDDFTPDGTTGWLYQPSTGYVKPNLTGIDVDGRKYVDY